MIIHPLHLVYMYVCTPMPWKSCSNKHKFKPGMQFPRDLIASYSALWVPFNRYIFTAFIVSAILWWLVNNLLCITSILGSSATRMNNVWIVYSNSLHINSIRLQTWWEAASWWYWSWCHEYSCWYSKSFSNEVNKLWLPRQPQKAMDAMSLWLDERSSDKNMNNSPSVQITVWLHVCCMATYEVCLTY